MFPYIRIFIFSVPTHQFFVFLAILIFILISFWRLRTKDFSYQTFKLFPVIGIGAILGSWLSMVIPNFENITNYNLVKFFLYSGRSLVGGIAGAYIAATLGKKFLNINFSTGNVFVFALAPALAIGRIGCFLTEIPGTQTSLPWSVKLSNAQISNIPNCVNCIERVGMHPSMLYEVLFHVLATIILYATINKALPIEFRWKFYLSSYAFFRFFVEFARTNTNLLFGLSGTQIFILLLTPFIIKKCLNEIYLFKQLKLSPSVTLQEKVLD